MSMELLGNQFLEAFYPPAEARRARANHLEGISSLPWIATVDAFQHWITRIRGHTARPDRGVACPDGRFGGEVDWERMGTPGQTSGIGSCTFSAPFYYVEYGIPTRRAPGLGQVEGKPGPGAGRLQTVVEAGGGAPVAGIILRRGCRL